MNENLANNAAKAAKLVKDTADQTAITLNISYIQRDITEIKQSIKEWSEDKEKFVMKDEFFFWRNLLVSGILLTIALGVVSNIVK